MSKYISNTQKKEYKRGLQLLDIIIGEMKQDNYPIKQNAYFIRELERMHEGVRTLLYPTSVEDIFWGSFIAGCKDMIIFNYRPDIDTPPMYDEEYLISKTLVLFNTKANTFYIVTRHEGRIEDIYDFKYFNLEKKEAKIVDGIKDADSLGIMFDETNNVAQTVDMVKELTFQVYA